LFTNSLYHFGIGIDTALPAPPSGDPDLVARRLDCGWCLESFHDYHYTAFSPLTVIMEILPLPFPTDLRYSMNSAEMWFVKIA
jgi:hypothetical protein